MPLVDDLAHLEAVKPLHGPRCTIEVILEQVQPAEAQAIIEAIDNHRIAASVLARTLTQNGYRVAQRTITRHRRRGTADGCRCD